MKLPKEQYLVLNQLYQSKQGLSSDELVDILKIDQVFISGAFQTLSAMEFIKVDEEKFHEIKIGKEAAPFMESGLPEKSIANALKAAGGSLSISEVSTQSGLEQKVVGKNIKVLQDKEWITKDGGNLTLTAGGKAALDQEGADEKIFTLLKTREALIQEKAEKEYPFFKEGFELLKTRSNFLAIKERTRKTASLTDKGKKAIAAGISEQIDATGLTPDLLKEGKWREVQFRPYDVKAESAVLYPGKIHPYQRILNETRKIYLEMGFTEIASPHVESAFWGFDALFQPQDHPARDMQDTFYMKAPARAKLPEEELVNKVRATHEHGGESGSLGWRYNWNIDLAKRIVLRTHTTAASIQQIHKTPSKPQKVFCIGRVFRREAVDYKHLPVFTQVDGIIVEPKASLAHLIGVIREFYRKMGFSQVEVRPAFFPYTEPSLEIFVYMQKKKDWVEMGGAGIFRKEVTLPMGCDLPVLAWGLGLERLAMFKYNLTDIRDIYIANIQWLKEVSSCQL